MNRAREAAMPTDCRRIFHSCLDQCALVQVAAAVNSVVIKCIGNNQLAAECFLIYAQ